jgi:ABC-2 type transport system permease protein
MFTKILPVIKREFLTRVKTKGFIIGTAILPLFMVLIVLVPVLLSTIQSEKIRNYIVVDFSTRVFAPLAEVLQDTSKNGKSLFSLTKREMMDEELQYAKSELSRFVLEDSIDGYMIIPKDVLESQESKDKKVEFYAKNVSNFDLMRRLDNAVSGVVRSIRLQDSGLDPSTISQLTRGVDLETFKVAASGEEKKDQGFTFAVTYVLVLILYMVLILYGTMITRSVVEEKNTRVVEMIVSSVKPFQLMTGKILGVGAVGLLQFLIWAGFMLLISTYRMQVGQMFGASSTALMDIPSLPLNVIVFFVVFFVLGFLFFATMYAAVGAMVNSDQEAQQVQMPLIMFLVVPILIMVYIIGNPDSTAAFVLSMIPFFSPIIMFMRISVLTPPTWEVALSILILILSILAMIWLTGKIYRVGILMYGKRPTLPELIKWIRYS